MVPVTGEEQEDFYEAFVRIVNREGLNFEQIEWNVRANAQDLTYAKTITPIYYQQPFSKVTAWRAYRGEYRPSKDTLWRILRHGLKLSPEECFYLEMLRRQESPRSHDPDRDIWKTTQPRVVAVESPESPDSGELQSVPDWVLHPSEGVSKS